MEKNKEQYDLWDSFLTEWPVSRIKNMKLEEYTQVGNPETFCNWIESRLQNLGSIWGGSSFKFGIFNRADKGEKEPSSRYRYTEEYAWEFVLGNTIEEAFTNVKESILSIIDAVLSNNLELIDNIPLWPVTKWKIAFLYQDRNKLYLVNIFRAKNLKVFLGIDKKADIKMSVLYRQVMEKRDDLDIFYYGKTIWKLSENVDKTLEVDHVLKALSEIDSREVNADERSSTYDLIHHAKRYPPKLVYSLAHKYSSGEELDRSTFEGGEDTQCFKDLRGLGFIIERKDFVPNLLIKFIKQADEQASQKTKDYPKRYCELEVNLSFGIGGYSDVPWISFLGYEQKTQEGIYPVYLYYKTINVLVLAYGISTNRPPSKSWNNVDAKETIRDYLSRVFDHTLKKYGYSYIFKAYQLPKDFTDTEFTTDLDLIIEEFHNLMQGEKKVEVKNIHPKNLIYYGPPGTGKTYLSMEKAVAICDGSISDNRSELVKRFKELQQENRISFVTFHQSYSYEDFVEGIRPVLNPDENDAESSNAQVKYECREGVFKKICTMAKSSGITSQSFYDFNESKNSVWKMSLGNTLDPEQADIYDDCIENSVVALGYGQGLDFTGCNDKKSIKSKLQEVVEDIKDNDYNITSVDVFKNQIKNGDLIIVSSGNLYYRAIGKVVGDYQFLQRDEYPQIRSVKWLLDYDENQPHEKIINNRFSQMTLYHLKPKVLKMEALKRLLTKQEETEPENYVLIIDEINRGNIAKIFGELITLLELDKRLGGENELSSTLPYSGIEFGVPNNVYVIGTMNTADRSIGLLDTALRRRFEFVELMPDINKIDGNDEIGNIPDGQGGSIDLRAFLSAINQRITFLLNRDMTIGHAYLINLRSFDELKHVLIQQIIPLLQEYFYEDWHRIQLVMRDIKNKDEKREPQIIRHISILELDVLGFDHDEYKDDFEYSVVSESEITPEMIRKVYEN